MSYKNLEIQTSDGVKLDKQILLNLKKAFEVENILTA